MRTPPAHRGPVEPLTGNPQVNRKALREPLLRRRGGRQQVEWTAEAPVAQESLTAEGRPGPRVPIVFQPGPPQMTACPSFGEADPLTRTMANPFARMSSPNPREIAGRPGSEAPLRTALGWLEIFAP